MSTQRIYSIEKYIGLSTDTRPESAMVGSTFYEYDTKNKYIVHSKTAGIANWVLEN